MIRISKDVKEIRGYDWLINNCGQNVNRIVGVPYVITPTNNLRILQLRQYWRDLYGI